MGSKTKTIYVKRDRILAFSAGCLILVSSAIVYGEIQFLGFPDGFLTELDRAEKILGKIFVWISIPTSLWFGFLGWSATQQRIIKKFCVTVLLYAAFVFILVLIDLYLRYQLDNGTGG